MKNPMEKNQTTLQNQDIRRQINQVTEMRQAYQELKAKRQNLLDILNQKTAIYEYKIDLLAKDLKTQTGVSLDACRQKVREASLSADIKEQETMDYISAKQNYEEVNKEMEILGIRIDHEEHLLRIGCYEYEESIAQKKAPIRINVGR